MEFDDEEHGMTVPIVKLSRSKASASGDAHSKVELLLWHLKDHEDKEQKTLEEYRGAIEKVTNPMAKFLLDLIGQDEKKHHELVKVMIATLERSVFWRDPPMALEVFSGKDAGQEELLALIAKFSRVERDGIKEYEGLLRDVTDYYEGLFSLILKMLIKDSEKHLMLLGFLEAYVQDSSK